MANLSTLVSLVLVVLTIVALSEARNHGGRGPPQDNFGSGFGFNNGHGGGDRQPQRNQRKCLILIFRES